MKRICVFCGASDGDNSSFKSLAYSVGKWVATQQYQLVYGGGSVGLMGEIAKGAMDNRGIVHGVIPRKLVEMEVGNNDITHLYEVETMHERKQKMYDLSDLFIALPGGFGTLDELFEIITWSQLKYHEKKCYVLNYQGFFDHLILQVDNMVNTGFLSDQHRKLLNVINSMDELKLDLDQK